MEQNLEALEMPFLWSGTAKMPKPREGESGVVMMA
jgi:hypothetical protein